MRDLLPKQGFYLNRILHRHQHHYGKALKKEKKKRKRPLLLLVSVFSPKTIIRFLCGWWTENKHQTYPKTKKFFFYFFFCSCFVRSFFPNLKKVPDAGPAEKKPKTESTSEQPTPVVKTQNFECVVFGLLDVVVFSRLCYFVHHRFSLQKKNGKFSSPHAWPNHKNLCSPCCWPKQKIEFTLFSTARLVSIYFSASGYFFHTVYPSSPIFSSQILPPPLFFIQKQKRLCSTFK